MLSHKSPTLNLYVGRGTQSTPPAGTQADLSLGGDGSSTPGFSSRLFMLLLQSSFGSQYCFGPRAPSRLRLRFELPVNWLDTVPVFQAEVGSTVRTLVKNRSSHTFAIVDAKLFRQSKYVKGIDRLQERVKVLRATELCGEMSDEALLSLASRSRLVSLDEGELLFSAGDPSRGLYVVIEGRTKALRHSPDGREQIMHEDGPGATFPEVAVFDDGPYPSTVIAVVSSHLLFIPKEDIRELCLAHPQMALSALRLLSRRLRRATGMVEDLALREVAQRLGEYLLERAGRAAFSARGRLEFELVHTNQEIADQIGSVREVVSRAFTKLQKNGWITKSGKKIRLNDKAGLEEYSVGEE